MHSNESKLFPMLLKWSVSSVESCRKLSRVTLRSGYQRELEFGCLFQDWINISGSSNTVLTEFPCLVAIRCSSVVLVKQQQQQKKNLKYLLNSAMRVWNMVLSFRLGNMGRALAHFFSAYLNYWKQNADKAVWCQAVRWVLLPSWVECVRRNDGWRAQSLLQPCRGHSNVKSKEQSHLRYVCLPHFLSFFPTQVFALLCKSHNVITNNFDLLRSI